MGIGSGAEGIALDACRFEGGLELGRAALPSMCCCIMTAEKGEPGYGSSADAWPCLPLLLAYNCHKSLSKRLPGKHSLVP